LLINIHNLAELFFVSAGNEAAIQTAKSDNSGKYEVGPPQKTQTNT
jgi:hypothetical protein